MKVVLGDRILGGADAVLQLAHEITWARPIYWLARLPGAKPALHHLHASYARRRHCLGGSCVVGLTDLKEPRI
jgi:hypothetical protein